MEPKQKTRHMQLDTPLGKDVLVVEQFSCRDTLNDLFEITLGTLSVEEAIEPEKLVGLSVTLNLVLADGSLRPFNGIVTQLAGGHKNNRGLRTYSLTVRPWLWLLTQHRDCRIFQEKSILDIIETVFGDLGFSDYKFGPMLVNHEPRNYCVQYRETDYNFVTRLMAEEGIFFFWEHEDGKHTLVMSDDKSAYTACPDSTLPVIPGTTGNMSGIKSWEHRYEFCSGKWSLTDYNYEKPANDLSTKAETLLKLPNIKQYEVYDYPGDYAIKSQGTPIAKLRMEATEVAFDTVDAKSECKSLFSGGTFTVQHSDLPAEHKKEYVITEIHHVAVDTSYSHDQGGFSYENAFICIPSSVTARPLLDRNDHPHIHGTQTAVVVGPSGEEIYTDKYGRVKVQFHWDRKGAKDENSSCWIRVAHGWAGKKWGQVYIPRIGQEVVITFLEGDPDRPLIIGSVYNDDQMPPYDLPDNKTQSGIKTRSTKDGNNSTFNEIRFEDKKGEEEVYVHAEKDHNTVVENDQSTYVMRNQYIKVDNDREETIGRDRSLDVGRDKKETVAQTKSVTIGQSHTEQIGTSMSIMVGTNLTETVALNYTETVGIAMSVSVGGKYSLSVGAAKTESVGLSSSENVGGNKSSNIGGNTTLSVGKDHTIEVGKDQKSKIDGESETDVAKNYSLKADKIQIVAEKELSIKVGDASILLKKNGDITISGGKIQVKGKKDLIMKGKKIAQN